MYCLRCIQLAMLNVLYVKKKLYYSIIINLLFSGGSRNFGEGGAKKNREISTAAFSGHFYDNFLQATWGP